MKKFHFHIIIVQILFLLFVSNGNSKTIEGVKFGSEYGRFYFFDTTWGMDKQNVSSILSKISGAQTQRHSSSIVSQNESLESFSINGQLIERDGLDFVCMSKFGSKIIFHFEFENEKLTSIYIYVDTSTLSDIQIYNIGIDFYEDIYRIIGKTSILKSILYNNKRIIIDSGYDFYICNGPSLSKAIWPPTTNMTLGKMINATNGIASIYDKKKMKRLSKNTKNRASQQTHPGESQYDMNNRIEFYNKNILQLLN